MTATLAADPLVSQFCDKGYYVTGALFDAATIGKVRAAFDRAWRRSERP